MVGQRNRINELVQYLKSIGIVVNIGKNKARGNKGFFLRKNCEFRIDVAKNIDEQSTLSVLLHEFAHYIHSKYDKNLLSLDFIFGSYSEDIHQELLNVTVHAIPKDFAASLFAQKEKLNEQIHDLSSKIKNYFCDFCISQKYVPIENNLKLKYKYLIKYDKVNIFNSIYSIDNINEYDDLNEYERYYILLCQKKRHLKKINTKISRMNKYYNNQSELFARFFEMYFLNLNKVKMLAPLSSKIMDSVIKSDKISEIKKIHEIIF